jgi:ankyrin repeat protein
MTKTRLRLLRECRSLRTSGSIRSCKKSAGIRLQTEGVEHESSDHQVPSLLPSQADSSHGLSLQEITSFPMSSVGVFNDDLGSLGEETFALLQGPSERPDVSLSHHLEKQLLDSDDVMEPSNRCQGDTTGGYVISVAAQTSSSPPATSRSSHSTKATTHQNSTATTLVPTRLQSCRSSIPSLMSLGRRLSMKYSESILGDVISIMRNLSVSSNTNEKRTKKFGSWWKRKDDISDILSDLPAVKESAVAENTEEESLEEIHEEHPVELPGSFSLYCWKGIMQGRLEPCLHAMDEQWPNCRPKADASVASLPPDLYSRILDRRLRREDFNSTDPFGNTALHIAIALGTPPSYLLRLLELVPDVNASNNAGQTFLHVVPYVQAMDSDDMRDMLKQLKSRGFNFFHRDEHGQTPLHSLARPWKLGGAVLSEIIQALHLPMSFIDTARDNLGRTLGSRGATGFSKARHVSIPARFSSTGTNPFNIPNADDDASITSFVDLSQNYVQNHGKHRSIETVEDLRVYEEHADLLRIIVKACTGSPSAEDSNGRNGLHCLAEVAFDLPTPIESSSYAAGINDNLRERYLEDLLTAGVDVHQHDKGGDTPLMSFIKHVRAGEDDAATTRILSRLCDAGTDINRRDRKGETPLHQAVKLGRRAATKFLLNRGANVHARNSNGVGILAIGTSFSRKARTDETLYAQIMLCIALVANAGAVAYPTLFHEWASSPWKTS